MNRPTAMLMRAWKTLVQSAIGAAATAALTVIGTSATMGEVNWVTVASTACLSAIVSLLMNVKAELPEVGATNIVMRDEDDRSDEAPILEVPALPEEEDEQWDIH